MIEREVWISYITVRDIIAMIEENPEASVANRRAAEALKAIFQRMGKISRPCMSPGA